MWVDLKTVALETNNLKNSTSAAVGNDLRKDVNDFNQNLRGIATNLQALTSRVETVELHAVKNAD